MPTPQDAKMGKTHIKITCPRTNLLARPVAVRAHPQ